LPNLALGDRAGRLAKLALIPMAALLLAACGEQANNHATSDGAFPNLIGPNGFPHEVVTAEAAQSSSLYLPIFLIAVVIFVIVEGWLLLAIFRFRAKGKEGELPVQTHGNNRLEIIWTAIPLVIVMVLFAASTIVLARVEQKSEQPGVVVDVVAQQFGWTFTYMERDAQTGEYTPSDVVIYSMSSKPSTPDPVPPGTELVLPVGEPVRFQLTSMDVIHSFYVPAFFFKRDVIPGRTNEFEVTIEKPGSYGGQCAEFCGMLHGQMFFIIRAVEPAEFEAWMAEKTGGAATASTASTAAAAATVAASADTPTTVSEEGS
jgi:cytochrome c oxidase subunit 2